MKATQVQAVLEDYVKVIYAHTEWQSAAITGTELAARLGLAPSTVTEMVKKLVVAGFVTHRPYGAIELTAEGRRLALAMVRRHRLIETWLVETYDYRWDEVHEEAEILEHALSDRLVDAIDVRLGRPSRDPHGDPIPAADGSVPQPAAVVLAAIPAGSAGAVVRISDRDPGLLRALRDRGISLDILLEIVGRNTDDGTTTVRLDGREHELDAVAAASIWVSTGAADAAGAVPLDTP